VKALLALLWMVTVGVSSACGGKALSVGSDGGSDPDSSLGAGGCTNYADGLNLTCQSQCESQYSAFKSACSLNDGFYSCGCACDPSYPACADNCQAITTSASCSTAFDGFKSCLSSGCDISIGDAAARTPPGRTFVGPGEKTIAFGSACTGDVYYPDGSGWAVCDEGVWGYTTVDPSTLGGYTEYDGNDGG
jgi:hypothetical protein